MNQKIVISLKNSNIRVENSTINIIINGSNNLQDRTVERSNKGNRKRTSKKEETISQKKQRSGSREARAEKAKGPSFGQRNVALESRQLEKRDGARQKSLTDYLNESQECFSEGNYARAVAIANAGIRAAKRNELANVAEQELKDKSIKSQLCYLLGMSYLMEDSSISAMNNADIAFDMAVERSGVCGLYLKCTFYLCFCEKYFNAGNYIAAERFADAGLKEAEKIELETLKTNKEELKGQKDFRKEKIGRLFFLLGVSIGMQKAPRIAQMDLIFNKAKEAFGNDSSYELCKLCIEFCMKSLENGNYWQAAMVGIIGINKSQADRYEIEDVKLIQARIKLTYILCKAYVELSYHREAILWANAAIDTINKYKQCFWMERKFKILAKTASFECEKNLVGMSKHLNEDGKIENSTSRNSEQSIDATDKLFLSAMLALMNKEAFDIVESEITEYLEKQIQISNHARGQLLVLLSVAYLRQNKVALANETVGKGLAIPDLSHKTLNDLNNLQNKIRKMNTNSPISLKRKSEESNDAPAKKKQRVNEDSDLQMKESGILAMNSTSDIESTLSVLRNCFDNKLYQEAELIADQALQWVSLSTDRVNLYYELAKACFMQVESEAFSEKMSKAESALEEAVTALGKKFPTSLFCLLEKSNFYLKLSIECLNLFLYKKAEVIAKLGINIRLGDFIKPELYLALGIACLFQEKERDAKNIGSKAINMRDIRESTKNNLKNLVNNQKFFWARKQKISELFDLND